MTRCWTEQVKVPKSYENRALSLNEDVVLSLCPRSEIGTIRGEFLLGCPWYRRKNGQVS